MDENDSQKSRESQEPQSGEILVDVPPKVFCWLALMCAAIDLFVAIVNLSGNSSYDGNQANNLTLIMLVGFLSVIIAVLAAVAGILGLQCEKNPNRAKPLFVICLVTFLLSLVDLACNFALDAGHLDVKYAAAQAGLFLVLTACANTTKKGLE